MYVAGGCLRYTLKSLLIIFSLLCGDVGQGEHVPGASHYLPSFGVMDASPHVLVLGSGGLIGKALVKELKSHGYHVAEVRNREHLDLRIPGSLGSFQGVDISFVFSLAYEVGGYRFLSHADAGRSIIESNRLIDENVFSYLHKSQLPFIWIGSALTGTNSSYGLAKENSLKIVLNMTNGKVAHPWNVYGSDIVSAKSHVIEDFVSGCLWNGNVTPLTDGRESRKFMHATDAALSLVTLMKNFDGLDKETDLVPRETPWSSLREISNVIMSVLPFCNFTWSTHHPVYEFPSKEPRQSFGSKFVVSTVSLRAGVADIVHRMQQRFLTMQIFVPDDNFLNAPCSMTLNAGLHSLDKRAYGEYVIVIGNCHQSSRIWEHFQRYERFRKDAVYVGLSNVPRKHTQVLSGSSVSLENISMLVVHESYWRLISQSLYNKAFPELVEEFLCRFHLELVILDAPCHDKVLRNALNFFRNTCHLEPIPLSKMDSIEYEIYPSNPLKSPSVFRSKSLLRYNYEIPKLSSNPLPTVPGMGGRFGQIDLLIRAPISPLGHNVLTTCMLSVNVFWPKHLGRVILILDSEDPMAEMYANMWPNADVVLEDPPLGYHAWGGKAGYRRQSWSGFFVDHVTEAKYVAMIDTDAALGTYGLEELMFNQGKVRAVGWHKNHIFFDHPKKAMDLPYSGYSGMWNLPALVKREIFPALRDWASQHVNKTIGDIFQSDMYSQYNFFQDMAWQSFREAYSFESDCSKPGIHVGMHYGWAASLEGDLCSRNALMPTFGKTCPKGGKDSLERLAWVLECQTHAICIALYVLIMDAKTRKTEWSHCLLSSDCARLVDIAPSQILGFQNGGEFATCKPENLRTVANDIIVGIINTAVLKSCTQVEHVRYRGIERVGYNSSSSSSSSHSYLTFITFSFSERVGVILAIIHLRSVHMMEYVTSFIVFDGLVFLFSTCLDLRAAAEQVATRGCATYCAQATGSGNPSTTAQGSVRVYSSNSNRAGFLHQVERVISITRECLSSTCTRTRPNTPAGQRFFGGGSEAARRWAKSKFAPSWVLNKGLQESEKPPYEKIDDENHDERYEAYVVEVDAEDCVLDSFYLENGRILLSDQE
eukprot:g63886.t1